MNICVIFHHGKCMLRKFHVTLGLYIFSDHVRYCIEISLNDSARMIGYHKMTNQSVRAKWLHDQICEILSTKLLTYYDYYRYNILKKQRNRNKGTEKWAKMASKPYLCQIDICKTLFKPFKLTIQLASFLPVYSQFHWIGLWDEGGQHDWVWITGDLLTDGRSNSWWNGGQPDHQNGQVDCTEMYPAIHDSRWNDQGCSQQRRYICEHMFWVHWTMIMRVNISSI